MNYKEDILDTFDKLMFFSKPIERETTPEIKEQNKIIREQWIQAIRDYLYEHEQISNSAPLEAFQLFCKELKIENSEFANAIEAALKRLALFDDENVVAYLSRRDEKKLRALEIIKEHKLLNYVLKNKKCANMYHLSEEEIDLLKEGLL